MILDDEQFQIFWAKNSIKQKSSLRAFLLGLSSGFAVGACVIIALFSGWYPRATMVATSKMSATVLFLAILGISVFVAFLYQKFRWEMQDQRYKEILAKINKKKSPMQP